MSTGEKHENPEESGMINAGRGRRSPPTGSRKGGKKNNGELAPEYADRRAKKLESLRFCGRERGRKKRIRLTCGTPDKKKTAEPRGRRIHAEKGKRNESKKIAVSGAARKGKRRAAERFPKKGNSESPMLLSVHLSWTRKCCLSFPTGKQPGKKRGPRARFWPAPAKWEVE